MGHMGRAWAAATTGAIAVMARSLAQGLTYSVSTCKDFTGIPTPMLDDTHVVVLNDIACKSGHTVIVSGPYAFLVSSALPSLTFQNLRFSVKDGADFFISLSSEEYQGTAAFISTAEQHFHGGTFKIDAGASVTFGVPVSFSGGLVAADKRGGAIYNNGYVTFEQTAKFENNEVQSAADLDTTLETNYGCGGAVYNSPFGVATFRDVTWFTGNTAAAGGGGGAVCNQGRIAFNSRTYFTGNVAEENSRREGGLGGGVYTAPEAITTFRRKANFRNNRSGRSGGAVHCGGVTKLHGSAVFSGNTASARDVGRGGHVYSSGVFEVDGDATFRSGKSSQYGGALFVDSTGDASFNGILEFIGNEAAQRCHDVYDASSERVCLSVD